MSIFFISYMACSSYWYCKIPFAFYSRIWLLAINKSFSKILIILSSRLVSLSSICWSVCSNWWLFCLYLFFLFLFQLLPGCKFFFLYLYGLCFQLGFIVLLFVTLLLLRYTFFDFVCFLYFVSLLPRYILYN